MCRRPVTFAVKFRIVLFIFLEDVVDGSQQYPGNSDDSLFVTTAFLRGPVKLYAQNCLQAPAE